MRKFSTFVSSGSLYRSSLHKTIGLFDTEVYHYWDWDFFLRVSDERRVNRVPSAGVLYDFSDSSSNQSKNLSSMRSFLDRLSEKHNLGYIPTKNFFLLLDGPAVKQRESNSKILWDGKPFISKLVFQLEENAGSLMEIRRFFSGFRQLYRLLTSYAARIPDSTAPSIQAL